MSQTNNNGRTEVKRLIAVDPYYFGLLERKASENKANTAEKYGTPIEFQKRFHRSKIDACS